ncbi:MAG: DNA recombination protein RmuC [Deltaproteobacteria bacterium]|nr:DNA recombination protein RmuC [Deltaproteobacteria bacterium]
MIEILLYIIIALLLASFIVLIILLKRSFGIDFTALTSRLDSFEKAQERFERAVKEEVAQNRVELGNAFREQRQELSVAFKNFGSSVIQRIGELTLNQKSQLETMSISIGRLSDSIEKKMEDAKVSLDGRLKDIQDDNAKQLEQMRQVVDEKLQGTLEKRLGESFRLVSERLEMVHKGLGEMQVLATGVGDLKKVLANVKTRGTWGEVQLGALLEQVLTPEQFATNIATKEGAERVEFAIKLPGQGTDKDDMVYLPIDAKFPVEDYQRLIEAQERGDAEAIEIAGRQLEARVKACAYDICSKHINPPKTTDFAILFLPIEGLFAEVIRRTGLIDAVQRECRVVVAGPTTLWSIMNSLQMGFRTLAIQRRSSEVWSLLAAVKTEWTRYGDILDAVQKKINQASDTIEKARIRSRVVGKKLKDVQELPASEATGFLPRGFPEDDEGLKEEES